MAINQLKGLPLGTSDFIALRMADEIYVDKTEMVFSLAVNRGKWECLKFCVCPKFIT